MDAGSYYETISANNRSKRDARQRKRELRFAKEQAAKEDARFQQSAKLAQRDQQLQVKALSLAQGHAEAVAAEQEKDSNQLVLVLIAVGGLLAIFALFKR